MVDNNNKKMAMPSAAKIIEDERGFFYESYNQNDFNNIIKGNINFVQDNHSLSRAIGTLRGFLKLVVCPTIQIPAVCLTYNI